MANLLDYLDWRGDLPLSGDPFNEVDNLILAELSFVDFGGIVPGPGAGAAVPLGEAAAAYFAKTEGRPIDMGVLVPNQIPEMLRRMAAAPRFRDMQLSGFVDHLDTEKAEQFAALTIVCGDGALYLSFRGTDDTLAGWKEDFYLSCMREVPAQKKAVEYTETMARQYPRVKLRLGGHSKGGNVAVYAAMSAQPKIKERLTAVYSHDGLGFLEETTQSENFRGIEPLIHKTLPQSSLIGMLLEHHENYSIVESDGFWIAQHDPFLWSVEKGEFVLCEQISGGARYFNDTLNSWVKAQTDDKRELFVDTLFQVLNSTSAETTGELSDGFVRNLPTVLGAVKNIDADTRRAVSHILRELFSAAFRNLVPSRREKEANAPTSPDA